MFNYLIFCSSLDTIALQLLPDFAKGFVGHGGMIGPFVLSVLRSFSEVRCIEALNGKTKSLLLLLATPIFAQEIIVKTNPLKTELVLEIIKKTTNQEFELCKKNSMTHALNLKNGNLDKIVNEICNQSDPKLLASKKGTIYKIMKDKTKKIAEEKLMEKKLSEIEDRVFEIYYLDIDESLNKKLNDFWKALTQDDKDAFLIINSEEKIIIARGKKHNVQELAKFIDSIDKPHQKIKLDVFFVTAEPILQFNLGINWSGIYNRLATIREKKKNFGFIGTGGTLYDIPTPTLPVFDPVMIDAFGNFANLYVDPGNYSINIIPLTAPSAAWGILPEDAATQMASVPIVFGGPNLNTARLNAIPAATEYENTLKIERKFSLITDNNKITKILIGESTPYYESISQTIGQVSPTVDSSQMSANLTYRDIGISLQIKTNIINDVYIAAELLLEHSRVFNGGFFYNPDDAINRAPARLNVQKTSTNIILENGQSAIILDYVSEDLQKTNNYISFIKKLPVIGKLFKSVQNSLVKTRRLMLITATIID